MNDTKRNDGGSAFPQHDLSQYGIGPSMVDGSEIYDVRGMSVRDWFAGQALAGIGTWMPIGYGNLNTGDARRARAFWAYEQADAMLAAREASR